MASSSSSTPSTPASNPPDARATPHDWELVQRYDRALPRYTSYPTAPVWHDLGEADAHSALESIAPSAEPLSVYVHLPFCDRMCLYCGCNVIVRKHGTPDRYVDALERELDMLRAILGKRQLVQLHFGGGTPTMLLPAQLERLMGAIYQTFEPTADAEISIEIDPMVTTREHLEVARANGFNRVSIGVQDFDDDIQRLIERNQPAAVTRATFATARELGFGSINLDLMYGLPGQTPEHLRRSAEISAELGADRVAIFGYAHVPWMRPHQRKLEAYGLPDAESRWTMFGAARTALFAAGYQPIGLDHFALPNDELARAAEAHRLRRNFQGYTVLDPVDLVGLGVSAIGDIGGKFLQNAKRLSEYYEAIEAGRFATQRGMQRSDEDTLRGSIITSIMCNLYLDYDSIEEQFGCDVPTTFAAQLEKLAPLEADGLVHRHPRALEVTPLGRALVRNVACVFDAYLRGSGEPGRFSRSI